MHNLKIKKNNKGFVILFAVTLAAILLSIALGVANIAEKQIKFGTSAKETNNAFFAADTGVEQALFNDRPSVSATNYPAPVPGASRSWSFVITGLGSDSTSCAKVTVQKSTTAARVTETNIVSKGYNIGNSACDSSNPDRIERELVVTY